MKPIRGQGEEILPPMQPDQNQDENKPHGHVDEIVPDGHDRLLKMGNRSGSLHQLGSAAEEGVGSDASDHGQHPTLLGHGT